MLDEEKIKLMTKVTIYEKNEGLDDLILSKYYKEDYVQYGCLKTLVAATFCYWIIVAVYILLKFEKVLADLNHIDYFKVISYLMVGYVATLAVFYIYAFIVYNYKYSKAKPGMVQYNKWLKQLVKSYESDEAKDSITSGRVKVYSGIGGFDENFEFEGPEDTGRKKTQKSTQQVSQSEIDTPSNVQAGMSGTDRIDEIDQIDGMSEIDGTEINTSGNRPENKSGNMLDALSLDAFTDVSEK